MAKALKTAALVVGAVALVATGVGAAAGVGIGLGLSTTTLATIATVAKIASVGAALLSTAATLTAKKPSSQATGSQSSFAADPDAGIPLVIGRTGTAGNIVARFGFDTKDAGDNDRQSFISVLSLGPVKEVEPTLGVDRSPVSFDAQGRAIGTFRDFMWRTVQVGLLSSAALTFGTGAGAAPGWTAQHKLSGKAATAWTLRFDAKAKLFQNGVPAPMNVVKGQFCYDPRKDSTYPGGSGPHRMADPADRAAYDAAVATWEYSECPYLNGLRYVHGYWQRDMANPTSNWQRVMGMGAPLAGIDLASFVEGANVSDANGWKVGGVIYSGDDKWASLKKVLQAGMGEPLALGAKVSCLVNAPKVSLATITIDDVVGDASVGATQPRRDRVNTITPRFRLEANNWQLLPGAPISVAQHVADDRGKRSRMQDYPLIQDTSQVGTAVRYDIENAREFGPIVLPCKLFWMGYKPGDCVTAELPELGLVAQPILLLNRALNPSSGTVTLTARSETPAKHPFALGQTATPPPTPGVTGAPIVPVPGVDAWAITGNSVQANGVTMPALVIDGAVDAATAQSVTFDYRPFVSGQGIDDNWIGAGVEAPDVTTKIITGVASATAYEVSVRYNVRGILGDRRLLGPVTSAAYVGLKGDPGQNAPLVLVQWSIDGATNWHFEYQTGDKFQRQSNNNGQSWSPAVRVVGESAQSGVEGISPSIVFIRSATVPATPAQDTGNPPPGWSDDPPVGTAFLWQSVSKFRGGMQLEGWSAPVRISGADGASAFTLLNVANAAVEPGRVVKASGGDDWNGKAQTREGSAAATVSANLRPGEFIGLTTDPANGSGFQTIDCALHWSVNTRLYLYRDGQEVADLGGRTTDLGPIRAKVRSDGTRAFYALEGYDLSARTHLLNAPGQPMFGSFAIFYQGSFIDGITFSVDGQAGISAPLVKTQWSIDGDTNWHDNFFGADQYYHQSNDGGATYGPAIKGVGEDGTIGADGSSPTTVFRRSATVPATPTDNTGNPPPGWSDGPPAGTNFLWLSKAIYRAGTQIASWSAPQRISGEDGYAVKAISALYSIPVFSNGTTKPAWSGGVGTIELRKGAAIITNNVAYSIEAATGVTSLALAGNQFSFAGLGLDGNGRPLDRGGFTVLATFEGVQYRDKVAVQRTYDGSAAQQNTINFNGPSGSGSNPVAGGRTVRIMATGFYFPTGGQGTFTGYIDLYYRNVTDNGVEVYAGRATGSQASRFPTGNPEDGLYNEIGGQADKVVEFTSTPTDKQYEYRVQMGGSGSSTLTVGYSGTVKLEVLA